MSSVRLSRCLWSLGLIVVSLTFTVPGICSAQTSPTDLTDLSLTELINVDIEDRTVARSGDWHLGYQYTLVRFNGYRKGQSRVSDSSLIGPPNGTTYPILQTTILQEAHAIELGYNMDDATRVDLVIPFIRQSTEHKSIVPGFSGFTIRSDGLGDFSLMLSRTFGIDENSRWTLAAGLGIPVGSVTEKGHTPAGPGSQLPYTMQTGSGTWDIPLSISYARSLGDLGQLRSVSWGGQAFAKIRTGRNHRGYRLGDQFLAATWIESGLSDWLSTSVRLIGQSWGRIEGTDKNFPGPIFPTPVADPDNFGGTKVNLVVGLSFHGPTNGPAWLRGQSFDVSYGRPIHQSLHGPQPEEDWRLHAGWGFAF